MEPTPGFSIAESLKDRIMSSILRVHEDDDDPHNEQGLHKYKNKKIFFCLDKKYN